MAGLWDADDDEQLTESTHYVLYSKADENSARISSGPALPPQYDNWMTGSRIEVDLPEPLIYLIDPEDEGIMRPYFRSPGAPLMSIELLAAIRSAGVDNIDTYDAVIRETRTNREFHNYKAVNIIGLISAADLDASVYTSSGLSDEPIMDLWFDKLVLDEDKITDNLFFRLAENVAVVLAHYSVVDAVEAADIPGSEYLGFAHPSERSG